MVKNPSLYEINTRVWIKKFGDNATLSDIPDSFFVDLKSKGIDAVWLMGIWETSESLIDKCCFEPELVSAYSKSLDDWKREDIIGSPFAINDYKINPELGTKEDLSGLKKRLNDLDMKLILDFIPNHFGADTILLKEKPEIFLQVGEDKLREDPTTFFKSEKGSGKIFAHGRDPLFPAWSDTVQIDYCKNQAREYMTDILISLAESCDGVRCDMAMLILNNIYHNTWLGVVPECDKTRGEFWSDAISKVKQKREDFVFIAEAYWELEWQLQQLGFDYTYDKKLTDRLSGDDVWEIHAHLTADKLYQQKSVRFLENHDELRAVTRFGKYKSLAAAVIISTLQGMRFYNDGQLEGKKIKIPVQLGREPEEKICKEVKNFYDKLLSITRDEIFKNGRWLLLYPSTAGGGNETYQSMLAWQWKNGNNRVLVVVNYSSSTAYCRLKFDLPVSSDEVELKDVLNDNLYVRPVQEIINNGLFIELKAYHSHILYFEI